MAGVEGAILPCGTLGCCPSRRVGPWGWGVDACGLGAPGALSLEQEAPQSGPTLVPVPRVNRCGTLFCEGGQEPPERGYCILTTSSGICRAVIQDGSTAYEPVPKGTKCGEEQVGWTCLPVRPLGSGRACRAQSRAVAAAGALCPR